jgi:hypothetical protein
MSIGAVAGIAIGAAALAAIVTALIAFFCCRRRRPEKPVPPSASFYASPMPTTSLQPHQQYQALPYNPGLQPQQQQQQQYDAGAYPKSNYGAAPSYATVSPVAAESAASPPARHASPAVGGAQPQQHSPAPNMQELQPPPSAMHEMQAHMAYEMPSGQPGPGR